jgi:hypothetical protein
MISVAQRRIAAKMMTVNLFWGNGLRRPSPPVKRKWHLHLLPHPLLWRALLELKAPVSRPLVRRATFWLVAKILSCS